MPTPWGPTLPRGADLDIEILREMYRAGAVSIFGIDPRLNASRIGRRLGMSRARVASRLRAWAETGFLPRYDVWPNPFLFGLTGVTFDLRLGDRLGKEELFERIGLLPGAAAGLEFLGEWISATFLVGADDDPGALRRILGGFAGVAEVGGPIPWAPPPAGRPLSPLELRIVRVLRQYPAETLSSVARRVGVSTRTITTRYGQLLDRQAVWFLPVFDFRALAEPVVSLNVRFRGPTDRESFGRAMRRSFPRSLEIDRAPFGPVVPENVGVYYLLGRSAARLEDLEGWVRSSPGVLEHEALTMVRIRSFSPTLDRLLQTAPGGPVAPGRREAPAGAREPRGHAAGRSRTIK